MDNPPFNRDPDQLPPQEDIASVSASEAEPETLQPSDTETPSPDLVEPSSSAEYSEAQPKEGRRSKMARGLRSALRWTLIAAGLIGIGFVAAYLLIFLPSRQQVDLLRSDLNLLQTRIQTLEADLETAHSNLAQVGEQNQLLRGQAESAQGQVYLLRALSEVNAARFGLAQDDPTTALESLKLADIPLQNLAKIATDQDSDLLGAISARLDLVVSEIATRPATAASDLEIMHAQMLELEENMFGVP